MDARVPIDPIFAAFEVPAIVTRPAPDDTPIVTGVVWIQPLTELFPGGMDLGKREWRRLAVLRLDQVPRVPIRTLIEAPEILGGPVKRWLVDGMDKLEADHVRVPVVAAGDLPED